MSDPGLLWYSNKQSEVRKQIAFSIESRNPQLLSLPLKYVCFSSKHILIPKDKFLKISITGITFDCFKSLKSNMSISTTLPSEEVLSIHYNQKNCLIMISLKESQHNTNEMLFIKRIWFCLDFKSNKDYIQIIKCLLKMKTYSTKITTMNKELYNSFCSTMYKHDCSENEFIYDWTRYLFKNDNIQPSSNESNALTIQKSPKSSCKRKKEDFSFNLSSNKKLKDDINCDLQKKTRSKSSESKYVYSPKHSHSIEITSSDFRCLKPYVYVNDNIINLYIAYIFNEIMTENQRQRTHIFNCFFNTKLIGRSTDNCKLDDSKIRHERVSKWTKNVDIFDKDFIIIPVIENQHWFLVIVCFPWMAGMIDYNQLLNKSAVAQMSFIPENKTEFATKFRQEKLAKLKAEDPQLNPMPCILVLDSLSLQRRTDKVNIIRDYLKSEWDVKRLKNDGKLIFDKSTVRGYLPKVPQQKNFFDCGIYLLHYLECFFQKPIKTFSFEYFTVSLADWFKKKEIDEKRTVILNIIKRVVVKSEEETLA